MESEKQQLQTKIIRPGRLVRNLAFIVLALAALGFAGQIIHFQVSPSEARAADKEAEAGARRRETSGQKTVRRLARVFDLNAEGNLPTLYQAIMMAGAGTLLLGIAGATQREKRRGVWQWRILGIIFIYMALDEWFRLHETVGNKLAVWWDPEGNIHSRFGHGWLMIGIPVAAVVGLSFLPFLFKLPRKTMAMFILSGGLYLFGAIVVEHLSGLYMKQHGKNLIYSAISHGEEVCEMSGIVIFLYALMTYIRDHVASLSVRLFKRNWLFISDGRTSTSPAAGSPAGLRAG